MLMRFTGRITVYSKDTNSRLFWMHDTRGSSPDLHEVLDLEPAVRLPVQQTVDECTQEGRPMFSIRVVEEEARP